jgi:hypothetical protein
MWGRSRRPSGASSDVLPLDQEGDEEEEEGQGHREEAEEEAVWEE